MTCRHIGKKEYCGQEGLSEESTVHWEFYRALEHVLIKERENIETLTRSPMHFSQVYRLIQGIDIMQYKMVTNPFDLHI